MDIWQEQQSRGLLAKMAKSTYLILIKMLGGLMVNQSLQMILCGHGKEFLQQA